MSKEQMLAFEEATRKNVRAVVDHSNDTRKMVNEVISKIQHLEKMVVSQQNAISNLSSQISLIKAKQYDNDRLGK